MIKPAFLSLAVTFCALPMLAQETCRQALAFGLDVSGSVDQREYRLQVNALAAALTHPDISESLLSMPGTAVRLAVFEWSGPFDQTIVHPWSTIKNRAALDNFVNGLQSTTRAQAEQSTGLGAAMLFGSELLSTQSKCWVRTLDISGDGKSNTGVRPQDLDDTHFAGITLNALVIGAGALDHGDNGQSQTAELSAYFNAYVTRGPNSFIEVALGFEDYERAMVRKLKRELQGFALSQNSQVDQ